MRFAHFLLFTLIFNACFSACSAQENFPNKLQLKKQGALNYNVNIKEDVHYKADTVSSNVISITTFQTSLIPLEVQKDSIKMSAKLKELRTRISGVPGSANIDTVIKFQDKGKGNINFRLNSRGKLSGISQIESQQEGIPYLPYFTQFLTSTFLELPSQKVDLNGNWNTVRVDTIRQGLSKLIINMPLSYNYKSNMDTLGFKCAEVIFRSTSFDISLQDELMKIFNIEYTLEGEGMIQGRMLIDRTSGKTVAVEQNSLTSYTLGIITPNNVKNSIPVKTSQHLKANLLK